MQTIPAFQVLNIKPSAKKYAMCDSSKELGFSDIAVCQHKIVRLDPAARELEVSMEPLSSAAAWSMLTASGLQSCYSWSAKTGSLTAVLADHLIQDVPSHLDLQSPQSCVAALYLAQAVPSTTNFVALHRFEDQQKDALAFLLDKRQVQESESLCQFTWDGVSNLRLTQVL